MSKGVGVGCGAETAHFTGEGAAELEQLLRWQKRWELWERGRSVETYFGMSDTLYEYPIFARHFLSTSPRNSGLLAHLSVNTPLD